MFATNLVILPSQKLKTTLRAKYIILFALLHGFFGYGQKLSRSSSKNFNEGINYFKTKQYDLAIGKFSETSKKSPEYGKSYLYRGKCYVKKSNFTLAKLDFEYLVNSEQFLPQAYIELGKIQLTERNIDSALNLFQASKKINPKSSNAYYNCALANYKLKKYDRGLDQIDSAILLNNKQNNFYNLKASILLKQNKTKEALTIYRLGLKNDPESIAFQKNFANCLYRNNQVDSAIMIYDKILSKDTSDYRTLNKRGIAYLKKKNYDLAEKDFLAASRLNPKFVLSHINLGYCSIYRKDFKSGITHCNNAIVLNKNSVKAYYNLGVCFEAINDFDNACKAWEKAAALGSEKAINHLNSNTCQD